MSTVTTHDPVGAYVRELDRRLEGPWRARRGLLQEVRDGLQDAAGALMADGVPRSEAERLAVSDFGPAADLAPEFQRELSVLQARRTAAWAALVLPVLWLAWDLVWHTAPDLRMAPPEIMLLARLTDVIGLGTALVCLLALVAMEVAGGRLRSPERLARAVGRTVLGGVLALVTTAAAMTMLNVHETVVAAQTSRVHAAVTALTLVSVVVVLRSACRCDRAAQVPPGASTADTDVS